MPEFKVNADVKPQYVDHAVGKALRDIARDATQFEDMIDMLRHWLSRFSLVSFAQDVNGEWIIYSTIPNDTVTPERRFDTFQQCFAAILAEIDNHIG